MCEDEKERMKSISPDVLGTWKKQLSHLMVFGWRVPLVWPYLHERKRWCHWGRPVGGHYKIHGRSFGRWVLPTSKGWRMQSEHGLARWQIYICKGAHINHFILLQQSKTPEEYASGIRDLLTHHYRDVHKWEGWSCDFHYAQHVLARNVVRIKICNAMAFHTKPTVLAHVTSIGCHTELNAKTGQSKPTKLSTQS